MTRIILGTQTLAVVKYVASHPGCSKAAAGRYDSVERAIRRGFVRAEQDHPGGNYRLFLTEAGQTISEQDNDRSQP